MTKLSDIELKSVDNSGYHIHSKDLVKNFVPNILIFGIGGAGLNAVNNMILSNLENVLFVAANTDMQSLNFSLAKEKIQLGKNSTRGLGAGAKPDLGKVAAEESTEEIDKLLDNVDMVFIAAGMGGGTGTGAAPIIAKRAKDRGILTIGVVTTPFAFEGKKRMQTAKIGVQSMEDNVDTLIVIENQNLLRMANENTSLAASFKMADDVLYNAVKCVVELLTKPGFINRDFADLKTVMSSMGYAMIGYSEASGDRRYLDAVEGAISNPILTNGSIEGAQSVLIIITGGKDMKLFEVESILESIRDKLDEEDATVLFGTSFDENMEGKIRVSIVATGMKSKDSDSPDKLTDSVENKKQPEVENNNKSPHADDHLKLNSSKDYFNSSNNAGYVNPYSIASRAPDFNNNKTVEGELLSSDDNFYAEIGFESHELSRSDYLRLSAIDIADKFQHNPERSNDSKNDESPKKSFFFLEKSSNDKINNQKNAKNDSLKQNFLPFNLSKTFGKILDSMTNFSQNIIKEKGMSDDMYSVHVTTSSALEKRADFDDKIIEISDKKVA